MRHEFTNTLDTRSAEEGDLLFLGVDSRRDPRQLEPGLCSRAVNKDFEQGVAMTRKGMQTVGWASERAVNFPLSFSDRDYEFLSLFGADVSVLDDKNFRIQSGTTLEIYCPDTELWHSLWISILNNAPVLNISVAGTTTAAWDYQEYDGANANFRIMNDRTFQLYCPDNAGFHTVYLTGTGGNVGLTIASSPSTPSGTPDANWYIDDGDELQLLNSDTEAFHSIYIEMNGGYPMLAIGTSGITEFGIDFDRQTGFGTVYGAAVFSDPYGVEGALIAIRNGLYRVQANQVLQVIRLPANEVIDAPVRMVQCFDRVVILRGTDRDPLVWNPQQTTDEGLGTVEVISQTDSRGTDADNTYGDGTDPIPAVSDGVMHNNRLFLIQNKDELIVSDILDYTRYSEATQRFKINYGEDDQLMRIVPYNQTTLLLFKNQSVYALNNVFGDLSGVSADVLSMEYGLVGRDAVVAVGKDVLFLSEVGVFALSQALDNKLQAGNEPISAPIQPVIDRINWAYASGSQMAYHDNRLYLAVPIDGATYNNVILVYNFLNRAWSGYWNGDLVDVKRFFRINYAGKRELWFVTGTSLSDSRRHGMAVLMNRDFQDFAFDTWMGIDDEVITRGYAFGTLNQKQYRRLIIDQSSWNTTYGAEVLPDGVNEGRSVLSKTPDRTKYMVFGKGEYDETNEDDDHSDPYREDYSVRLQGNDVIYLQSGVSMNRMQRRQHAVQPRARGGYIRLKLTSSGGRHGLHGVAHEAIPGKRSMAPYS